MSGLILLFWFVAGGVALRYFVRTQIHQVSIGNALNIPQVLFIGVMSDMYVLWDVVGTSSSAFLLSRKTHLWRLHPDDTIARKVNGSDASAFAEICGCCPSQGNAYLSHRIPLPYVRNPLTVHERARSMGRPLAYHRLRLLRCRRHRRPRRLQGALPDAPISELPLPSPCFSDPTRLLGILCAAGRGRQALPARAGIERRHAASALVTLVYSAVHRGDDGRPASRMAASVTFGWEHDV